MRQTLLTLFVLGSSWLLAEEPKLTGSQWRDCRDVVRGKRFPADAARRALCHRVCRWNNHPDKCEVLRGPAVAAEASVFESDQVQATNEAVPSEAIPGGRSPANSE